MKNHIFSQVGVQDPVFIGDVRIENRHPKEIFYYDGPDDDPVYSVYPNVNYRVPASYGSYILSVMDAHGGWVMTARDVAKVGNAMINLKFFGQNILNEILKRPSYIPQDAKTFYSLGMNVTNTPDNDIMLSHTGALTFGTFGFLGMMVNKKISIAVITNHLERNIPNFLQGFGTLVNNSFNNPQTNV